MPASISLTGQDTIQIGGRVLKNFADGAVATLTYPNDKVAVKTGKNGNAIYAVNATGRLSELVLRILRGSPDDQFLNAQNKLAESDLPSYVLMPGYLVKRIGDGLGNVKNDTYLLAGGVVTKNPGAESNVEGNTEQSITVWNLKFSNSDRATL